MRLLIAVFCVPMLALAQDAPLAFEVASVKPSLAVKTRRSSYFVYTPQGIEAAAFDLHTMISEAYQIPVARVSVPDAQVHKIVDATYDIIAKAERTVAKEQAQSMLQTLLAERFKLTVHRESRQQPVYRLVVGKQGSKLPQPITEAGTPRMAYQLGGVDFSNVTMKQFCERLSTALDRPVLDATRIEGAYTFSLKIDGMPSKKAQVDVKPSNDLSESSIFTDLQQQLGLQLVADKAPLEFIVVTYAVEPSEN